MLSIASVWWGLAFSLLALVGNLLLPGIFYLWMTALGGGGMIALGLYIRSRWWGCGDAERDHPLMMLFLFGSVYGNEPTPLLGGYGTVDLSMPAHTAMIIATGGLMSITITMAAFCWTGAAWSQHTADVLVLAAMLVVGILISAKTCRWE